MQAAIDAILLAGGKGERFGGLDKGLIQWRDDTFIAHIIKAIEADCQNILISCNRNIEQYQSLGMRCVSDAEEYAYAGPLAGIAAAASYIESPYCLVLPCDTPLIPVELIARLYEVLDSVFDADIAVVHDGQRQQHLCFLARREVLLTINDALQQEQYAVKHWLQQQRCLQVDFSDQADAFANFNSEADLP